MSWSTAAGCGSHSKTSPTTRRGSRVRWDRVEPTGPYEDDPNVTDKRFPGIPTRP